MAKPPVRTYKFTARRIVTEMKPETGKTVYYRAEHPSGLAVRVTPKGAKSFVYETKIAGKSARLTVGPAPTRLEDPAAMTVAAAESEVARLKAEIRAGRDPRITKREAQERAEAKRTAEKAAQVTFAEVWAAYVAECSPQWSERYREDHAKAAAPGGEPYKRGSGTTKPGALAGLMQRPLRDLDREAVSDWLKRESANRATQARLACRMLSACLRWAKFDGPKRWRELVAGEPWTLTRTAKRAAGKPRTKDRVLAPEEMPQFFTALAECPGTAMRGFILFLVLTGCRLNEASKVRLSDVDRLAGCLRLHDKATQHTRAVPLTPMLESLIAKLQAIPGDSEFLFPSPTKTGAAIENPNKALGRVCEVASIPHTTPHDLRRSFITHFETADLPGAAAEQIAGHAPKTVTERHYRRRSIHDLARLAGRYEEWLLGASDNKAAIEALFPPGGGKVVPLRRVAVSE